MELNSIPGYVALTNSISEKLKNEGRIFVRFSGTEPLIRVLVEGPDKLKISAYAGEIAQFLEKNLSEVPPATT